jgi:hypothetical protein
MRDTHKMDAQAKRLEEIRRQHELDKAARDIVRRLAEWETGVLDLEPSEVRQMLDDVAKQAATLWAEMQKGGGDEV